MYRPKRTLGDVIFEIFLYFSMIILVILFIYPVREIIVTSFSTPSYSRSLGIKIWPDKFNLNAYREIFKTNLIAIGYMNTIYRTVFGTILAVLVTYFGGYALTKKSLPFRKGILLLMLFTMFFGGGLIPRYLLMKSLGLVGKRWALILPGITSAWNLIIARNFISTIPDSIEEAAFIDGANPLTILFYVLIPLSMPIIAVLSLWEAVEHWNAWFDALIYTNTRDKLVLQLILRRILIEESKEILESDILLLPTEYTSPETVKAATIVVSTAPIILFYPYLQKYFVKGVLVGSLKG
ncbi:MAG: carbohydrate ABC transporter permease [Clostridiaceae bacterium]|nr:carbohydrate ABC transporter permease [Clostridiaceae bacterium]